jgi:hypothetical protein
MLEEEGACVVAAYQLDCGSPEYQQNQQHTSYASIDRKGADHGRECYICIPGAWTICHSAWCIGQEELPQTRALYLAVIAAASKGDTKTVMRLSLGLPQYVSVNLERGAVQIGSCSGAIAASLNVSNADALRALSEALAVVRPHATANTTSGSR